MNYQSSRRSRHAKSAFPRVHRSKSICSFFSAKNLSLKISSDQQCPNCICNVILRRKRIAKVFSGKISDSVCKVFIANSNRGNVLASGPLHVRDGQYIARVADSAVISENHGGCKISTGETSLNN